MYLKLKNLLFCITTTSLIFISLAGSPRNEHIAASDDSQKSEPVPKELLKLLDPDENVDWEDLGSQQRWKDLNDINQSWKKQKRSKNSLFELVLRKNPELDRSALRAFVKYSFCLDGEEADAASVLYFHFLRQNPKFVLDNTNQILTDLNETTDGAKRACMGDKPKLNWRTDAFEEFSDFLKGGVENAEKVRASAITEENRTKYDEWKAKMAKSKPEVNKAMQPIFKVLDKYKNLIFPIQKKT